MLIAHLPAGYLLAKTLQAKLQPREISTRLFFSVILFGAVFPDLDLFYFYLIDQRAVHHHQYFLHWFSFWIPCFLIALLLFKQYRFQWAGLMSLFCGAAILHICLDVFVGDVWLFAPFIHQSYAFFEVTARYQPWWLNFILHWSFLVEILICLYAGYLYFKQRKSSNPTAR